MMDENKNDHVKRKFLTELSLVCNNENQNNGLDNLSSSSNGLPSSDIISSQPKDNVGYSDTGLLNNTNLDFSQKTVEQCTKDLMSETTVILNLLTPNDSCANTNSIENTSTSPLTIDETTTQLRLSPLVNGVLENDIFNSSHACLNVQLDDAIINLDCDDSVVNKINDFLPNNDASLFNDEGIECKDGNEEKTRSFFEVSPNSSGESSLDSGVISLDDTEANNAKISQETVEESKQSQRQSAFVSNPNFPSTTYEAKLLRKRRSNLSDPYWSESKRKKSLSKIVSFKGVTVYYFSRKQSFVTVPSQGGSTLGMGLKHIYSKDMTINQHKRSISRRRRSVIKEQKRQQQIDARIKQLKQKYPGLEMQQLMSMVARSDPEEDESSSSDEDDDDVYGICEEEDHSTEDEYFFLQPIPTKKRRMMLRMAGVQKIDSEEKITNRMTRESREICGCDCQGVCLPSTCQCHLHGIPCQVDRESFPCGCQVNGCHNENGRIEFDSERVKHHYIHTMRHLRLEETGAKPLSGEDFTTPVQPKRSPYVDLYLEDANTSPPHTLSVLNTNNNAILNTSSHTATTHFPEKHVQFTDVPPVSPHYCNTPNQWSPNYSDNMNNMYYNANNNCAQQFFPEVNNNNNTPLPEQSYNSVQLGFNSVNDDRTFESAGMENLNHPELYQYLNPAYSDFKEPLSRYGATVSKVSYQPLENCPNTSETQFKLDPIASFLPLTTAVPIPVRENQVPEYTTGLNDGYQNSGTQQVNVYQQTFASEKEVSYLSHSSSESANCPPLRSECSNDTVNALS